MNFIRSRTRKVDHSKVAHANEDAEVALPSVEESVTTEGQPGKVVGSFTYPTFEAAPPPELVASESSEARVQRQVVVVGADPAGLTLTLILARQGIAVTLLDPRRTLASSSRAATWTAHTLELWACAGGVELVNAMLQAAVPRRNQELWLAGGSDAPTTVAELEIDGRPGRLVFPHALHLQQYYVEHMLYDSLQKLPDFDALVDIRWQSSVDDIAVSHDGVMLQVSVPVNGGAKNKAQRYEIAAAYAVVCSAAAKNAVRERTATPQPRGALSVTRTVLTLDAEVLIESGDGGKTADRRLYLSRDDIGEAAVPSKSRGGIAWLAVSARKHPDNQLRVDAVLSAGVDLPRAAREDGARQLIQTVVGQTAKVSILSCAAQQCRVGPISSASKLGRLFFCGEALAVVSPFGGAGGNLGVQDAANLAWKLALVLLQGAPQALLETYHAERDVAHHAEAERQLRAEQILAPATSTHRDVQQVAVSLLRAGQQLGLALIACAGAVPPPAHLDRSRLNVTDGAHPSSQGAIFSPLAPCPGDVFVDASVEDLELEVDCGDRPTTARLGHGFLLGHLGSYFTLIVFVFSPKDIPWDALRSIDRSKLQFTLQLMKKVVVILDSSRLERMSDAHIAAVGRARRLDTALLADRGGAAAAAYDARPGTTWLVRPDLCIAARWRELRPRDVHDGFLQSTGHLLHAHPRKLSSPTPAGRDGTIERRGSETLIADVTFSARDQLSATPNQLFIALVTCLASAPADRRFAFVTATALLLANHVGSLRIFHDALAVAANSASPLANGSLSPPRHGGAVLAAADADDSVGHLGPLHFKGQIALSVEVEQAYKNVSVLSSTSAMDTLCVDSRQELGVLVPPDAASETLVRLLQENAEQIFSQQLPLQGDVQLCDRIAAELSQDEDVDIRADAVMVADGPCAALCHLLVALSTTAPGPSESSAALDGEQDAIETGSPGIAQEDAASDGESVREILLVGPCQESWKQAFAGVSVRRFDPPPGPERDFAVRAEDVARHVAANTTVVLLPLFSLATGVPPKQDELKRLGEFVDYESARRATRVGQLDGPPMPYPLTLVVDVTQRPWQLDVGDEDVAGQPIVEPLQIFKYCTRSLLLGDLFSECSAAPALQAQFIAAGPDGMAGVVRAATSVSRVEKCRSRQALVQRLAASIPQETSILESLRRRREVLREAVSQAGIAIVGCRPGPRVGRHLCGRLPEDIDEQSYCTELQRHGVAAEAGTPWGVPGCVRLTFGEKFTDLEDSVPKFAAAVRELRQQMRTGGASPFGVASVAEAAPAAPDPTEPEEKPALEEKEDATDVKHQEIADNLPGRMRDGHLESEEATADDQQLAEEFFAITLHKTGTTSLGLKLSRQGSTLLVHEVGGGLAQEWNMASPHRQVCPGDHIVEVNGVCEDLPSLMEEMQTSGVLNLRLRRAPAAQRAAEIAEHDEAADAKEMVEEEVDPDLEADTVALTHAEQSGGVAPLAAQLRRGARGIACVSQFSGSITTELIAQAGFEIVIVDHENGPGDFGDAAALVSSALGAGSHVIFRLCSAEISQVRRALEAGAEGVILPGVTSASQASDFAELVRTASKRIRDDEAVEWRGLELADGAEKQEPADGKTAHEVRQLVAVEIDPFCESSLRIAESILSVDGIDMVFLDPERSMDAIAVEHGLSGGQGIEDQQPQAVETEAEAAAGGGAGPFSPANRMGGDGQQGGSEVAKAPFSASAEKLTNPLRRGITSQLRSPPLHTQSVAAAAASPGLALALSEAKKQYWTDFDALPALAAERKKLVGCSAHARTPAWDLLVGGHCIVVLAADLVLLREGAVRHAAEMKADGGGLLAGGADGRGLPKLAFATPLESARARLATGALVSQLKRQKKALGAFLHLGDPLAAELVSLAGFEAVVLDHEQGPGDLLNAISLVHAAASAGTYSLLRVPGQDPAYLRRALQLGVEGLILPKTETADQASDFVSLARRCWPTSSLRGAAGPAAAALRSPSGGPNVQHLRRRGEELLLKACQVETEAGLAAVKDIARVDGVDMVFFAPVELAASAPRGQEAGLLSALEAAEAAVKRAGKLLGGMSVPGRSVEQMFHMGYDLVCTTSDVILIRAAAENIVREAKPPATSAEANSIRWVASGRVGKLAPDAETLVARLKNGRKARALGVLSRLGSPMAAELMTREGFEVVVLDHARGPGDLLGAVGHIHAAARAGAHAIIRVPALSHAHLRRALQIGVEGVILPHVEDANEARALVELCLYPTKGYREDTHAAEARMKNQPFRRMDFSFAPPLVEFYGQRVAEFTRRQGEAVLIAAQVDTPAGAQKVREIAKVTGIDMIFIDATRLSGADVERIEAAAKDEGRLLGGLLVPGCTAEQMFRAGYKLVCAASDYGLLGAGARMCLRAARGQPTAPAGAPARGAKKPPVGARRVVASPAPSPSQSLPPPSA